MKELPIRMISEWSARLGKNDELPENIIYQGVVKPNSSSAFVYWKPADLLTETFESTITFETVGICGTPHLIDMLDGSIHEIPENMMEKGNNGIIKFKNMPVTDYPLLLTFGDFAE